MMVKWSKMMFVYYKLNGVTFSLISELFEVQCSLNIIIIIIIIIIVHLYSARASEAP